VGVCAAPPSPAVHKERKELQKVRGWRVARELVMHQPLVVRGLCSHTFRCLAMGLLSRPRHLWRHSVPQQQQLQCPAQRHLSCPHPLQQQQQKGQACYSCSAVAPPQCTACQTWQNQVCSLGCLGAQ
jgi:hypothetical protein